MAVNGEYPPAFKRFGAFSTHKGWNLRTDTDWIENIPELKNLQWTSNSHTDKFNKVVSSDTFEEHSRIIDLFRHHNVPCLTGLVEPGGQEPHECEEGRVLGVGGTITTLWHNAGKHSSFDWGVNRKGTSFVAVFRSDHNDKAGSSLLQSAITKQGVIDEAWVDDKEYLHTRTVYPAGASLGKVLESITHILLDSRRIGEVY